MPPKQERSLASSRRIRGVVSASINNFGTKLTELEKKPDDPSTLTHAQRLGPKLESLNSEFKTHHYSVVELITKEDELDEEQSEFDVHEDTVAELGLRVQRLVLLCSHCSTDPSTPRNLQSRKLGRVDKELKALMSAVDSMDTAANNTCRLQLHQDKIADLRRDLTEIRDCIFAIGLDDTDKLMGVLAEVDKGIFTLSLHIKELLQPLKDPAKTTSDSSGVKLPKLDTPTFSGNVLEWQTFWEQFRVSVHDSSISDAEKLVYLRQALKDGSARSTIEGLSRSGEHYVEAIAHLRDRFDRPRLIQQSHVKEILEVPRLNQGSGKELRKFHDVMQQHIRALKSMGCEPSDPFLTSLLELKLDVDTSFEWQKHTQDSRDTPKYQKLLDFVNLRAQASEISAPDVGKRFKSDSKPPKKFPPRPVDAYSADVNASLCVACKMGKHPLYSCTKFRGLLHEQKLSILHENRLCINCLGSGHYSKECRSNYRCKKCQRPHHTLLHRDGYSTPAPVTPAPTPPAPAPTTPTPTNPVSSNTAMGIGTDALMMTCAVLVSSPDHGTTMEARALLDSASTASFVSERLTQALHLRRSSHSATITGIAGLSHKSPTQSVTSFSISPVNAPSEKIGVTAVVVSRVTGDLPHHLINYSLAWTHLSDVDLADPRFGQPGKIDILLGVDIFAQVLRDGRRTGAPGSPVAFETQFGWVLAGEVDTSASGKQISSHHVVMQSGDDILRQFWEVEHQPLAESVLSIEEKGVEKHFQENHFRSSDGMFVVPLPKRPDVGPLGESRSQAVRRFLSLERSLHAKHQFSEVDAVVKEYIDLRHAEPVSNHDLNKSESEVFYLPIHVVRKEASSTTKVRAVFDASAKSASDVSLNETFLVGPTIHSTLLDVLLRFRSHKVALATDVSKMYRAVGLIDSDKDLHRFVWRSHPDESLVDYRMTRVTFGVSASSFAANMAVRQNADDLAHEFPAAAKAVQDSFYVDDGLTGSNTVDKAISLRKDLQEMFARGRFLLRKWKSNSQEVLDHIPPDLREQQVVNVLPSAEGYSKTLGLEWNSQLDSFRLTISEFPGPGALTKRQLVSDVAKVFDALGWFAPTTVKMKILLQRVWESGVGWDDAVPPPIQDVWSQWRVELPVLADKHIMRCYVPPGFDVACTQLHGFSDASEDAYAAVVYLRLTDACGNVHVSLVISKTKVAPIKRLTIPRLELCGAHLLSKLLHHVREILSIPLQDVFGWTDSSIVLSWMQGNPRRFKTYVGNRISGILDLIPPERWKHVRGVENPADCISRGLFPKELVSHDLWWNGPPWLCLPQYEWPSQAVFLPEGSEEEKRELCCLTIVRRRTPIVS